MRAVQITGFGGPEALEDVDVPEPEAGAGPPLHDVSAAGVNDAGTHHRRSRELPEQIVVPHRRLMQHDQVGRATARPDAPAAAANSTS